MKRDRTLKEMLNKDDLLATLVNSEMAKAYDKGYRDEKKETTKNLIKQVKDKIEELNKKYPSQCYGSIGIAWNKEMFQFLDRRGAA